MTDNPIPFIKENMQEGEFLSIIGLNLGKAFISVLIIIGAVLATAYLFSLQNFQVMAILIMAIFFFVIFYIQLSKIVSFQDFIITDKMDYEDNFSVLVKAQIISWFMTAGFLGSWQIIILLWTAWYDPLSQAILKILGFSAIVTIFFLYAKRDEVWLPDHTFDNDRFLHYIGMGFVFGIGTYSLGGIIVLSSEILGWLLTAVGIGLEIIFASVYTYMDLQYWINNYKQQQISDAEWRQRKQDEEEAESIATRLGGKYGNA